MGTELDLLEVLTVLQSINLHQTRQCSRNLQWQPCPASAHFGWTLLPVKPSRQTRPDRRRMRQCQRKHHARVDRQTQTSQSPILPTIGAIVLAVVAVESRQFPRTPTGAKVKLFL